MIFARNPVVAEQQITAIILYLAMLGYVDGRFHSAERELIEEKIAELVYVRVRELGFQGEHKDRTARFLISYFEKIFARLCKEVEALREEGGVQGENVEAAGLAKLRLRCFEILKGFDADGQKLLFSIVDELIVADGVADERETRLRDQLITLLTGAPPPPLTPPRHRSGTDLGAPLWVAPPIVRPLAAEDHALLAANEQTYSSDPDQLAQQLSADYELACRAMQLWNQQRAAGRGALAGRSSLAALQGAPFLDGHVYGHPARPRGEVELLVLGDLHGCYSCLKAALLQSDFLGKVAAFRRDPWHNPDVKLVLLGDYIDRGHFSYDGVLRAVLRLFVAFPEHVYILRGNHEDYVDLGWRIASRVMPAEAMAAYECRLPRPMFSIWMQLFDAMPSMLLFDRMVFVHGGIPRDNLVAARWRDLESLNDPELRYQMMWSDPVEADYVPPALQDMSSRFSFGRRQFRAFMDRIGARTMIRGHERIEAGFRKDHDDGEVQLFTLFSAGGADNSDLPPGSSYRTATPMALTIQHRPEGNAATPWPIAYATCNHPARNGFYRWPTAPLGTGFGR